MLRNTRLTNQRGAILIVVLALLSLFAIVGITFVLVAGQHAEKQRILRDASGAENGPPFVDDGQGTFAVFLSQLLTDTTDSGTGLQSSLRGHSLMATMYGRYSQVIPTPILGGTTVAWNGTGNFAETAASAGVNRQFLINHRLFPNLANPSLSVVYDPEITGERLATGLPGSGTGSVHIPKNAPYTYPDINNLLLASICPATGEVLVPSFFRQAAFGTLDRNNPNWTNATGKYLILRPRPQEHPQFQYPPMNADGTTTGDVQNLPGGYVYDNSTGIARFISRNDSIWIDSGMPIITGRDGKRYKPLVAPLILDLDGRVNLSVAGNRMLPVVPPPAAPDDFIHTSGHGLGTWEISLEKLFAPNYTQEARNLVYQRGLARNRANQLQQKYAPRYGDNQEIPLSAQVAWTGFTNGGAGVKALQYPPTNMYQGQPTFALGHSNLNALATNHPALFNPTEWPGLSGQGQPRGFSIADTKLLSLRHAFSPSFYSALDLATFAPNSLRGSFPVPNPNPPQQNTLNSHRLDPAHTNRHLVTTHSFDLDRPGQTPSQNQATNAFAALGGIDLNRTLADYRVDNAQPLVPANMNTTTITIGTAALTQADLDRQRFARDIFARLIVANSPAMATLDGVGNVTIDPTANAAQLNVLRGLAQLAANIVDYIDNDDVSTSFVWNPAAAADPYAPTNYDPAQIGNRVVFGTEKPRFTISEFYAEVVNDPNDPGATGATMASFAPHVRLWGEFRNASTTPYSASINGPQGDGAVRLQYDPATEQGATPVVNPYRVEIVRNVKGGANVSATLRDPALSTTNVTGAIVGAPPDLIYGFTQSLTAGVPRVIPPADGNAAGPSTVVVAANVPATPAGPQFTPARTGWNVINADPVGGAAPFAFASTPTTLAMSLAGDILAPEYQHLVVLLRRLANPNLPESPTNPYITIDVLDHVRAGDRIIRADNSNMDRSPKMTAGGQGHDPNTPPAAAGDPDLRPQASGKVQPYASFSQAGLPPFPNSMVMYQEPATAGVGAEGVRHTFSRQNSRADVAPTAATYAPASGATNANLSGETIMTPFDWLVHLDRPLINQIELLHVSAGKPHELTLRFLVPKPPVTGQGADVQKSAGTAQFLPVPVSHPFNATTLDPYSLYPSLYRALDLLRIQPYGHQTALGGRIPGKININTIQDKRVWDALFDAQPGHGFTQTDIDTMWAGLMATRTRSLSSTPPSTRTLADGSTTVPCPVPGATIFDANASDDGTNPYDRPFLPLGAATIPGGATAGSTFGTTASAFRAGISIQDTILRTAGGADPGIWFGTATDHPYQRAEALRKIMNNTTTVSNVFAVWVTVGYFEVVTDATLGDTWGKEYYLEVPGDMRQRLFAIVDRTQIGLDPVGLTATPKVIQPAQNRPFFTMVELQNVAASATPTTINIAAVSGDATAVQVYSDGVPVHIVPSATPTVLNTLVIGSGADQEIVNVTAVSFTPAMPTATPPTPAYATLTVASLAKDHTIGTCVSNMVPGNPGPQNIPLPTDDFSPFRTVIPHWSRIE